MTDLDQVSHAKNALLFRWHFAAAVIVGLLLAGGLDAVSNIQLLPWALAMEFGPWAHPLNLIMSVFVFAAIPVLEAMKRTQPELIDRLRITQIGVWWSFWILLGLACRFGTWRGP
jgi:hypothetical protein